MSMCMMPLVIKAEMTRENYLLLLKEAVQKYRKHYLRSKYQFDGSLFVLDVCDMDTPEIFDEAVMIARYAKPSDERVGLIFSGGCTYHSDDLYFRDGKCIAEKVDAEKNEDGFRDDYLSRRLDLLNDIPDQMKCVRDMEIEEILAVDVTYKTVRCLGFGFDELYALFLPYGLEIEKFSLDDGGLYLHFSNSNEIPERMLAKHFGYKRAVLFSATKHQDFPMPCMVMLFD